MGCHYVPNAFLMSCLIFIGTFLISSNLKGFKTANFFPTIVRLESLGVHFICLRRGYRDLNRGPEKFTEGFQKCRAYKNAYFPEFHGVPLYSTKISPCMLVHTLSSYRIIKITLKIAFMNTKGYLETHSIIII